MFRVTVMGTVMKRHGDDTMTVAMTVDDTISVIAEVADRQGDTGGDDTMTLVFYKKY